MVRIVLVGATALLLAACQSDSQRDRALVGGGLGAATGAVIGATAGAMVGAAAGHYLATRNERYASREQAAMARTDAAQREAAELARTARASEQVAAENRARLRQLEAQVRSGQATASQLAAQQRSAQQDLALMDSAIDHSRKVESAMRQDGVPDQAASVAESRRRMEDSARQLREALAQSPKA